MNIAVFLGSSTGNDPIFMKEIYELGQCIGKNGHTLIYGGSESGLMGAVAKGALDAGGDVIGIEPQMFIDAGYEYDAITKLIVTETMSERKTMMIEMSDLFITFPGGIGTLDEISEVMTLISLDMVKAPVYIYNLNGYYEGLKLQFNHMVKMGFLNESKFNNVYFIDSFEELKNSIS